MEIRNLGRPCDDPETTRRANGRTYREEDLKHTMEVEIQSTQHSWGVGAEQEESVSSLVFQHLCEGNIINMQGNGRRGLGPPTGSAGRYGCGL